MNGLEEFRYKAEAVLTSALKFHPENKELRSALVEYFMLTQQAGKAELMLQDDIKKNPRNAESHLILVSVYADSGRYNEALAMARKAISLSPEYEWLIRGTLAEIYTQKGDKNLAINEYQKVLMLVEEKDMYNKDGYIQFLNNKINALK